MNNDANYESDNGRDEMQLLYSYLYIFVFIYQSFKSDNCNEDEFWGNRQFSAEIIRWFLAVILGRYFPQTR